MSRFKTVVHPDYARLQDFVDHLPERFEREGTLIYDSRNKVRTFEVEGETLVVKRYKIPMLHQRMDYTWRRPSKAMRAYLFALRLLELGIDTPVPVACIEEYSWGLFRQGYFVSTHCPDANAKTLREDPNPDPALISSIAACLVRMHEKGVLHGDTNLSNFLYRPDASAPWGYHITTIDVNRSTFKVQLTTDDCARNLCRLTHVRPLLQQLVTRYAEIRGLNPAETLAQVMRHLESYEKKRAVKRLKKRLFKR